MRRTSEAVVTDEYLRPANKQSKPMTTNAPQTRRTRRHERGLVGAVLLLLLSWAGWYSFSHRDALVVWSCGGNYEFLTAYVKRFEAETGRRVRYTAAPVQYLLDLVVTQDARPDVIVGRGGPGWKALQKADRLVEGPVFFAIDPLVIAVAPGNPKAVKGLLDLGRPGMRVAQAPTAMRPKGKVPALFMEAVSSKWYPGLVERWENNAVVARECGRELMAPILAGKADVSLVPRSITHYPECRGRIEIVPIPAKDLLALKKGRPSLPQCAGVLCPPEQTERHKAALTFVAGLRSATDLLSDIGYLTLESRETGELKDLLKIGVPKDMPAWQIKLAELLDEYDIKREALRRYLKVVYTFGPNHFVPRSLYQAAIIANAQGQVNAARSNCAAILANYPPTEREEFDSPVMDLARPPCPVSKYDYHHWIRAAREFLSAHPADNLQSPSRTPSEKLLDRLFPLTVRDGDPPKNGTREFGLGMHLLKAGETDYATRDLLKVVTLNYPSRYMDEAECLLGLCAKRRGLTHVARTQWERTVRDFPGTNAARCAEAELASLAPHSEPRSASLESRPPRPAAITTADSNTMPPWEPRYDTHAHRGMTYGMRLFEHSLPLFAFKEMIKVPAGVYGDHELDAEARFRAGVAAEAAGCNDAALRQLSVCMAQFPNSEWARKAQQRLTTLDLSQAVRTPAPEKRPNATRKLSDTPRKGHGMSGKQLPAPGQRPKSGTAKRFFIAEEFRKSRLFTEDQIVLEYLKVVTVAAAPKGKADILMATATFRLAQVLEETGRYEAAKTWYAKVVKTYPNSPWAKQVE